MSFQVLSRLSSRPTVQIGLQAEDCEDQVHTIYIYFMYITTYQSTYTNLYPLCYLDLAVELDSQVQLKKK